MLKFIRRDDCSNIFHGLNYSHVFQKTATLLWSILNKTMIKAIRTLKMIKKISHWSLISGTRNGAIKKNAVAKKIDIL